MPIRKSRATRKSPRKSRTTRKSPRKSRVTRKSPRKSRTTRKSPRKSRVTRKSRTTRKSPRKSRVVRKLSYNMNQFDRNILENIFQYTDFTKELETEISKRTPNINNIKFLLNTSGPRRVLLANEMLLFMVNKGIDNEDVLTEILDHGANPNLEKNGRSVLMLSIENHNDTDFIEQLIMAGANVNYVDSRGNTPLVVSIVIERKDVSQLLINNGANVNIVLRNYENNTPLLLAVKNRQDGVVEELLKAGADINVRDSNGQTPLQIANIMGDGLIKKIILKYSPKTPKKR